jgi:hypothetical protein
MMTTGRYLACLTLVLISLLLPAFAGAQVTADDFLPPVQGGPTDIKEPSQVKREGNVVTAPTAQDAINAAAAQNVKEVAAADTAEVGAKMVQFPSGMGFVATGAATYRNMDNPTATRIAKRQAYVIAFTQAKKNLAEILGGLSNEGRETVRQALTNINLPQEEMTNIATNSEEAVNQALDMLLRGFIIYEVRDDTRQNTIFVTIVTTPKTRGKLARPAPNVLEVADLRAGLDQVIAEVKSGLVPPVGGRIIMMPTTGETAFVGFGSAIVRTSENAPLQAKLNLESQKIAAMRAKDALCGLIIGDRTSWQGGVVESMQDEVREFEIAQKDDPLAENNSTEVKKLEQTRQVFIARLQSSDVYQSARKGVLPPGVAVKTWFDDDHAWAFGMSVYTPSLTKAGVEAAREMKDGRILQPLEQSSIQERTGSGSEAPSSAGFTDEKNPEIKRPSAGTGDGPTGKVANDKDL